MANAICSEDYIKNADVNVYQYIIKRCVSEKKLSALRRYVQVLSSSELLKIFKKEYHQTFLLELVFWYKDIYKKFLELDNSCVALNNLYKITKTFDDEIKLQIATRSNDSNFLTLDKLGLIPNDSLYQTKLLVDRFNINDKKIDSIKDVVLQFISSKMNNNKNKVMKNLIKLANNGYKLDNTYSLMLVLYDDGIKCDIDIVNKINEFFQDIKNDRIRIFNIVNLLRIIKNTDIIKQIIDYIFNNSNAEYLSEFLLWYINSIDNNYYVENYKMHYSILLKALDNEFLVDILKRNKFSKIWKRYCNKNNIKVCNKEFENINSKIRNIVLK